MTDLTSNGDDSPNTYRPKETGLGRTKGKTALPNVRQNKTKQNCDLFNATAKVGVEQELNFLSLIKTDTRIKFSQTG